MQIRRIFFVVSIVVSGAVFHARADVKLPALFGDNMVLQRGAQTHIWGTADAGEHVRIKLTNSDLKGETATAFAVANHEGEWSTTIAATKAGTEFTLTVSDKNQITLNNVAVGDVWVASGQSNMTMPLRLTKNGDAEASNAKFHAIRFFNVAQAAAVTPQKEIQGEWIECSPDTAGNCTAVGYYFAKVLSHALNVPIGIVHASIPGSPAQAWTPASALAANHDLQSILKGWQDSVAAYPAAKADYDQKLAAWQKLADAAKTDGKSAPEKPVAPLQPRRSWTPSELYNAMIAPLTASTVRGIIWYQGEADLGRAAQYRTLFPALITSWRAAWHRETLPFYFVQIANFLPALNHPADSLRAELREAQTAALNLPETGMITAIDIGDPASIQPKDKEDVGSRLANLALAKTYQQNAPESGPIFQSLKIEGAKAVVTFKADSGVLMTKENAPLRGFAMAGADKCFAWATGKIAGNKVILESDKVKKPVAVRYDWADSPDGNLINGVDLPAFPFRTDHWENSSFIPDYVPPSDDDDDSATPATTGSAGDATAGGTSANGDLQK